MTTAPETRRVTVAPIEHGGLLRRAPTPIVFDDDIIIAATPAWYREIELPAFYPQELKQLQEDAEFAILVTYSTPAATTEATAPQSTKAHDRAYENVMLAQMALWLAGTPLQVRYVTDCGSVDDKNWVMTTVTTADHMLTSPDVPIPDALASAEGLSATYRTLRDLVPDTTVRVAVNTALKAVTESDWILRYLCYWLSLEALFGAEDGREISFRLSQRIAFHLRSPGTSPKDTFDKVREGYTWRSKVVHGVRLGSLTPEHSRTLMNEVESTVRDCLNSIVRDRKRIDVFNGKKDRERYLDALPFDSVS